MNWLTKVYIYVVDLHKSYSALKTCIYMSMSLHLCNTLNIHVFSYLFTRACTSILLRPNPQRSRARRNEVTRMRPDLNLS